MNNKTIAGLVAGALVIGLFVGLALGRGEAGKKEAGPGPTKIEAGVPVGYERSRQGAIAAAGGYASALRETALLAPDARRRALNLMSARDARSNVEQEAAAAYELIDQALGLPEAGEAVVLRSTPLGYRLRSFTGESAHIEVWSVDVVGKAGVVAPQAAWGTTSFELRWESGDWKLASFPEQSEGPTPELQGTPSPATELVTATRDLKEFSHAPTE